MPMNDMQANIVVLAREALSSGDTPLDEAYASMTDEELAKQMFFSYRGDTVDSGGSLRLTSFGLAALQKLYESHEIAFKRGYELKARHILKVERLCRLPYWLDAKIPKMIVFDPDFATFANMLQGDLGLMTRD